MNDNELPPEDEQKPQQPVSDVISFEAFQKGKKIVGMTSEAMSNIGAEKVVPVSDPKQRHLIITLNNDEFIEVYGYLGLTNSFLAVGDKEGLIKFAVAAGNWQFVTDVTDLPQDAVIATTEKLDETD